MLLLGEQDLAGVVVVADPLEPGGELLVGLRRDMPAGSRLIQSRRSLTW